MSNVMKFINYKQHKNNRQMKAKKSFMEDLKIKEIKNLIYSSLFFLILLSGSNATFAQSGRHAEIKITSSDLPDAGVISGANSVYTKGTITLTNSVKGGSWSSADTKIATVNASGVVTGVSAGAVDIIYTVSDGTLTNSVSKQIVVSLPVDCSNGGTLLFKEDFGGNLTTDPPIRQTPLPGDVSQMNHCLTNFGSGCYTIVKNARDAYSSFHNLGDHTNPGNTNRGYLMVIDPANGDINKILYQTDIDGLCSGVTLSFSAWVMSLSPSATTPKIMMQIVNKDDGSEIYATKTITIPNENRWRQEKFNFVMPDNITGITFKIINKENSTAGNDLGLDDIEIRLCTPTVSTSPATGLIVKREGESLTLSGVYVDDGTFGDNLSYYWEYNETESAKYSPYWEIVTGTEGEVYEGVVASFYNTESLELSQTGFYRLVVGNTSTIENISCRAISDVIQLKVASEWDVIGEATPGGVTNPDYTWNAWLTPENYHTGRWMNLFTNEGNVGDFTAPQSAPVKLNTGYNFHPTVSFPNGNNNSSAPYRLHSTNRFSANAGDNITTIFVLKHTTFNNTTDNDNLMAFSNDYRNGALSWNKNYANLSMTWSNRRDFGAVSEGILVVDNANNNVDRTGGFYIYKNGAISKVNVTSSGRNSVSNQTLAIASGENGNSRGYYGYDGTIQEVIILKGKGENNHVSPIDIQKIHSYLAIKYGITLDNSENYINSNENVVWDRVLNDGYNKNIFGIGRDDAGGLYQKQSHSVDNKMLTVFVGNNLETLNSQNTGLLRDKHYLLFGSNGAKPISPLSDVKNGDEYENGTIQSPEGFNIQSSVFKSQLTSATGAIGVKLFVNSLDFQFLLISDNADFTPEDTKFYPIINHIVEVEFDKISQFVKFIGFAPGPGGVSDGLKLWLRADDNNGMTIENLPSSDPKLSNYPDLSKEKDLNNIPAVSKWSDAVRDQIYSYDQGPKTSDQRIPVFVDNSPEMNYHPTIRFWANPSGNTYSSFLSNTKSVLGSNVLDEGKHTAYFLVNNFSLNGSAFTYQLSFGDTRISSTVPRPGYGVQKTGNNISGYFRTSNEEVIGNSDLFKMGETSIMGYSTNTKNANANNPVRFRFNGVDEKRTSGTNWAFNWNSIDFTRGSILGGQNRHDRSVNGIMSEVIFFDRELESGELALVESYMALKYGVTLRPSDIATKRFDYRLSNGKVIWKGDAVSGKFVDFYNNIAAIVRDDASRLENRHSHSTNSGSLLHLGVAGSFLKADGSGVGGIENDMEAVIFGNNGQTEVLIFTGEDACGELKGIFKRKWLIHKEIEKNRPITLLVGAQNNYNNRLGENSNIKNYYDILDKSNDIYLIIADSPEDIDAGIYKAIIPMAYINGEHQCSYTFTEIDTYITFGYKPNNKGCVIGDETAFAGTKKFEWTQWTSKTNNNPSSTLDVKLEINEPVDLGDDIIVTQTKVSYPSDVKAIMGYPRSVSIPTIGSLEVKRGKGATDQDIEITITFNHPVIPEFSISGLDAHKKSKAYEEVTITGECSEKTFLPVLSYASTPKDARYIIDGNKAKVTKKGNVSGSKKEGMVNVKFTGGVTSVTIKYRTTGKIKKGHKEKDEKQHIYISPITLRSAIPLPPVSSDGMSFVKEIRNRNISTCEPAEFSFFIQNATCDDRIVNFSDILPENLHWEEGSIGLDAKSSELNPDFDYQIIPAVSGEGEELKINGLIIPKSTTLIMTANAIFGKHAYDEEYSNRASITYSFESKQKTLQSFDRETLEPYTFFYATPQQDINTPVEIEESYSSRVYRANSEIEVTYKLANMNNDITGMYLDIEFNEEFTYLDNSFHAEIEDDEDSLPLPALVDLDPDYSGSLMIAGNSDGDAGFTLPTGKVLVIKYSLKAPDSENLQDELDEDDIPTGKIEDLEINYSFYSTSDDPCAILSITDLQGNKIIPFNAGIIITPDETQIEKCEGELFELSATYNDDGLFGKSLIYRWEYSETGDMNNQDDWSVILSAGGTSSDGTIESSFSIDEVSITDAGYYRLTAGNKETIDLWTERLVSQAIELVIRDPQAVVWTGEAEGDEQNWDNPDNWMPAIIPSMCNNVIIPGNLDNYPVLESPAYCNDIYFIHGSELARPDLLTYRRAYIQYNFGLWQADQVTNKDDKDLVLNSNATKDRLLYSASVSAEAMEHERWYVLSSPLKSVVAGDLSFGGFPLTFLRKFGAVEQGNANYQVGKWTTSINSFTEPVSTSVTDGFAFFMYGYDKKGNANRNLGCEETGSFDKLNDLDYLPEVRSGKNYGIKEINGVLELPSYADSTKLYAHRTQVYDNNANKSTFYNVYDGVNDLNSFNKLSGKSITHLREPNNGNYRFAPEIYNGKTWDFQKTINHPVNGLKSGVYFLAGNPYMSSIDMVRFCRDNENSIDHSFNVWNGKNFDIYTVDIESGEVTMTNDEEGSPFISPLQGFMLKYSGKGDVEFNVENISTVRPANTDFNLRSAGKTTEENIIRIKAENKQASSYTVIGYKEGAKADFVSGKDAQKIFSPLEYVPEIYSLAGDIPTAINFIDSREDIIIPLGIKTEQTGEIKLTVKGMDNYFKTKKIEFVDALENKIIDITGKESYSYTFNNTEKGIKNGRFSLRLRSDLTSIPDVNGSDNLNVYGDSKGIYVISSSPVQKVEIYDLTGIRLYESNLDAKYYPLNDKLSSHSPFIVKVITKSGVKTVKIY